MDDLEACWVEWDAWVRKIYDQVVLLHHRRQIFQDLRQMLADQGDPHAGFFFDVYEGQYIDSQAMAIRRMADEGKDARSLRRLIGQVDRYQQLISRQWFIGRNSRPDSDDAEFYEEIANGIFDEFAGQRKRSKLDRGQLQADLRALEVASTKVVDFATSRVAHLLEDDIEAVTWDEFNRAIDEIGRLVQRYYKLITGASVMTMVPVIQGDWKAPFRRPLARPFS